MKTSIFLAMSISLFSFCGSSYALDPLKAEKRCRSDRLTFFEGLGRNDWALRCNYISSRTYNYNVFDDYGNMRRVLQYPSYYNPSNFDSWFSAPRARMSSCERHSYTKSLGCNSDHVYLEHVLSVSGELLPSDVSSPQFHRLIVVDNGASAEHMNFTEAQAYVQSSRTALQDVEIVTIYTQDGSRLMVSSDHPLLLSDGTLKSANLLTPSDALVNQNGKFEQVALTVVSEKKLQLNRFDIDIDVTQPSSESRNRLVVTQGFVSGYLLPRKENKMSQRLLMRDSIPESLLF
ncbi:hypothetical protein [Pseudoalteromonas luteoviolacea]|uniref:Hint domain-containing protein n=1 Tax=Pseudoalteromonas luteoviolacea S4060-1 TaxID=1365257 RepID=A0A162C336_9GAMM|nr:hypothetical protein [Pseudoalteromonas luteoviolacea]KZN61404.1 hypothetical protein N478_04875 [Pseudoalteromonas luteoviolacea S4060-1]